MNENQAEFTLKQKLWVQKGTTFFFGPIFIHPEETEHEPTKMFYKREVFLSHLEETLPMTCVIGTAVQNLPELTFTHNNTPVHPSCVALKGIVLTLCEISLLDFWQQVT